MEQQITNSQKKANSPFVRNIIMEINLSLERGEGQRMVFSYINDVGIILVNITKNEH